MNPIVAAILPTLVDLAEKLIKAEGPSVINYLEAELATLKLKYGPPTPVSNKTDLGSGNH